MSDFVTYEMAVKLRDAGFPQPSPAFGQVWYNHISEVFVGRDKFGEPDFYPGNECFFAPTATDILRELDVSEWSIRKDFDGFTCWDNESFSAHETHENPAEAAAACYLKRKGF